MKASRRKFVKTLGVASLGMTYGKQLLSTNRVPIKEGKMKLSFRPYDLKLKHTFTVAEYSRDTTPVVLTEIVFDGITGYGEASLPPYLGETQYSVMEFLKKVDLSRFNIPFLLEDICI